VVGCRAVVVLVELACGELKPGIVWLGRLASRQAACSSAMAHYGHPKPVCWGNRKGSHSGRNKEPQAKNAPPPYPLPPTPLPLPPSPHPSSPSQPRRSQETSVLVCWAGWRLG
jgi:hypothetical protein